MLLRHHAEQARRWAEAADREATAFDAARTDGERAEIYAGVSRAHSAAALSTAIVEEYLAEEALNSTPEPGGCICQPTQHVRGCPVHDPKPAVTVMRPAKIQMTAVPRVPGVGELAKGDRVLCIDTEGHAWPEILEGEIKAAFGRVVEVLGDDLFHIQIEVLNGRGPIIQFHREQLRRSEPEGNCATCGHARVAHRWDGCFYAGGADQAVCPCDTFIEPERG